MNDLLSEVAITFEVCGAQISRTAAVVVLDELGDFSEAQIRQALKRCRREVNGRLTLADIIGRIDDGRPGPDEAWAICPRSEEESLVWTDEIAEAFGVALPLLEAGDKFAARAAFKDAYVRLCAEAREAKRPVSWWPSFGTSIAGRQAAIAEAVERGRLSRSKVEHIFPDLLLPQVEERPRIGGSPTSIGAVLEQALAIDGQKTMPQ